MLVWVCDTGNQPQGLACRWTGILRSCTSNPINISVYNQHKVPLPYLELLIPAVDKIRWEMVSGDACVFVCVCGGGKGYIDEANEMEDSSTVGSPIP